MCTGELHVTGLAYNLSSSGVAQAAATTTATILSSDTHSAEPQGASVRGKLNLECQGPRLNDTKAQRASRVYGIDRRLDIHVVPAMPRLEVSKCHIVPAMPRLEVSKCHVVLAMLRLEVSKCHVVPAIPRLEVSKYM